MRLDVVGIDTPCMDLGLNVDNFPRPNGAEQIRQQSWQGGGKVSTGMVAAARLGAKGAMIGSVGDDRFGDFCAADFRRHGLDTEYLLRRKGCTTALSVVLSDKETNGRCFVYKFGTAEPMGVDELPVDYLTNTDYFYIATVDEVTAKGAQIARQAGAKVFIDADNYSDALPGAVEWIDVFIGSEFVYDAMFGDDDYEKHCRSLMERGPEIVVFTHGPKGCVGVSRETGYFQLPTYEVPVADTVGAGDVFHGAFLAGLLQGWDAKRCADFSNAVSSIKCTRIGGRAGIPDMKTVREFMETGKIDYSEIDQRVEFYERGIDHV